MYVQRVSSILNKSPLPFGQWYAYDMRNSGTATFTCLAVNSTLRLYTSPNVTDKAEVGINFYDRPYGLFNGMKFKDMLAGGIIFEYDFFKEIVAGGNSNAAPAIKLAIMSPTVGNWSSLVFEPYQGGCSSSGCVNEPPTNTWHFMSIGNTTGASPINTGSNKGWWKTGSNPGMSQLGSLAAWATWFGTAYGPAFMADAVVVEARIGVGTVNPSVTSHVSSLRIAANGYDWKWNFGNATQCSPSP
jgi:hypothetical protein